MDPAIPIENLASQAIVMGASLVGATPVAPLLESPSHRRFARTVKSLNARSVVVLALGHAKEQPEKDWWDNQEGRTPGNRQLIKINRELVSWLKTTYSAEACDLPYNPGRGGVFLKDAAVLAGLGVMGKNNLLITPQYGPRVRLRALLLNRSIQNKPGLDGFAPCDVCSGPCWQACPQNAFKGGRYQRRRCQRQMQKDEANPIIWRSPVVGMPAEVKIAYCRQCELVCPVGQ